MARISPVLTTASPTDQLDAELGRLLERLQHSILYVDAARESALRASDIERAREERNLAYARSVLTRLEHESVGLKAHLLRQDAQGGLNRKREALEVLMDRMRDLNKVGVEDAEDEDADVDSQDEMLASIIIPTPSESMDSRSADHSVDMGEQGEPEADTRPQTSDEKPAHREPPKASPPEPASAPQQPTPPAHPDPAPSPPTTTAQTLRPRRNPTPRAALLHRKSPPQQSTTAEALLDRQRAEQDGLVENILGYASALKDSSRRFHDTLEADKGAMERAAEGMDRAGTGMEGAARRMGVLGKMSEGRGWWGRVILFAWVYGLMVLLVVVVFVLPKLRF